jgi:membrane associated rhomboid family serine protease
MQALHQPITSLLSFALIGIFAAIHQRHAGYSDVGMSYDRVLGENKEFWRCGTSQLAHVELLHLVFNLSALWSVGIAEQVLGQLYYLKETALLFLLSPVVRILLHYLNLKNFISKTNMPFIYKLKIYIHLPRQQICLALYHGAIKFTGREHYRTTTAVGYSCVLFGWMTVLAVRQPGGITMLPLFGAAKLPMWLTPFGSLLFTSLVIPKASFVGHLSGILAGYLISIPVFDYLPAWVAIVALVVAAAGMAVNYSSQHGGLGEILRIVPVLSKIFGGSGGDLEGGGGVRGRLLGGGDGP